VATTAGCASAVYRAAPPGVYTTGQLQVTLDDAWNEASSGATLNARPLAKTYTRDGLLLDRLMLISEVSDGESIFRSRDKSIALPVFHPDMLPNELEELMESSILKLYGEGEAAVSTENLRPHDFGGRSGIMFDITAAVTESPDYRGMVGAFIAEERLYMIIFLAAEPYYYGKHKEDVTEILNSATIRLPAKR
jgi:hypothetical protein